MAVATRSAPTLITKYLEMTSRADFAPAFVRARDIEIVRMEMPDLGFYKFLYQSVGDEWAWRDRLQMPNAELRRILTSPATQVHVLYVSGSPAGYVELTLGPVPDRAGVPVDHRAVHQRRRRPQPAAGP